MNAVVDSSALVAMCTVGPGGVGPNLERHLSELAVVYVPDIVDMEFNHALRGLVLGKRITLERAEQARDLFTQTPKLRYSSQLLADRVWELRHNLGAYDACFVVLAETLQLPLITCDDKQATASGHYANVQVYPLP